MSKWIYRYLDCVRNEIDMGPYNMWIQAQAASNRKAKQGAIVSGAIEVEDEYELFKPKYV